MQKILILFFLIQLGTSFFAQVLPDTVFFDKDWDKCLRSEAKFYRIYTQEKEIYKIDDYYLTGELQMTGHFLTIDSTEVHDGLFTYYHQNGQISETGLYKDSVRQGDWNFYHENGTIAKKGTYVLGEREGEWIWHYNNGKLEQQGKYWKGEQDGEWFSYHKNGALADQGKFLGGKKEGEWKWYDDENNLIKKVEFWDGKYHHQFVLYYKNGQVKRDDNYKKGTFIDGVCYSESGKKIKHFLYNEEAYFKGGMSACYKYIGKSVKYPKEAIEQSLVGRVVVSFVVSIDGTVTDAKIVKGVHPLLNAEALRVIKKMPKWNPGKMDGKPVKSRFVVPINFKL